MLESFESFDIMRDSVRLHGRHGGSGRALLLHGHPQTHAMWHRVAPQLAERFTVNMMDLRGYAARCLRQCVCCGDSTAPWGSASMC